MPGTPEANREMFIPNEPVGKYICTVSIYCITPEYYLPEVR